MDPAPDSGGPETSGSATLQKKKKKELSVQFFPVQDVSTVLLQVCEYWKRIKIFRIFLQQIFSSKDISTLTISSALKASDVVLIGSKCIVPSYRTFLCCSHLQKKMNVTYGKTRFWLPCSWFVEDSPKIFPRKKDIFSLKGVLILAFFGMVSVTI